MPKQIPTFAEFRKDSQRRNLSVSWFETHPDVTEMVRGLIEGDDTSSASVWKYLAAYYDFPFGESAFRTAIRRLGLIA